jgi:cytochrome c
VTRAAAAWLLGAAGLAATLAAAAAAPDRGARAFQRCYACHSVVPGETGTPGPNLHGVLGRRAGTRPGFRYSPALVEAGARGLVWTREALDAFLADPERLVPGTEMAGPGLPDAALRRDVIDYLERGG